MDLNLKDKVVIVTGGSKGIGLGITLELAAEGAIPFIVGRNEATVYSVVNELKSKGHKAGYAIAELTNPDLCKAAVEKCIADFGTIHGLVNNAGLNDGVGLESGNYQGFVDSLHNNLIHYYLMAHHSLAELKKNKGAILNISSKTADTGQGGTSGYAASNGGRNALTREWALELLPYSVRVNALVVAECYTPLYDSWIKKFANPEEKLESITKKIPFENRMTSVKEIADTVLFLLSERSSHTTGQLVYVDGGYTHLDRSL
ncbi:SDR family oxidoreductase [Flavobacteriaceae bacterium]|nr:SDR family oxidoreductase [Flavobacteriaceae bacterium]